MHNAQHNAPETLIPQDELLEGAFSPVPRNESDILSDLSVEHQVVALRGLARRQAHELRYDDKLNVLKESAFSEAIEADIANHPTAERGLFFVDLGNFKKANGKNGSTQHIGDDVLKTFVSLFRRDTDLVGRLGGDEFAAYVDLAGRNDAKTQSQKKALENEVERITDIRTAIIEKYPFLGQGSVQFFVGVGGVQYDQTLSYASNRQLANIEMGSAKDKGYDSYGKYRTSEAA